MKYAFVGGTRVQAEPKLSGICPSCKSEVISKCGKHVIWHWAHRSRSSCDPWWENETAWHRGWKNRFPAEWQEITHQDPVSRDRHIADVKTSHGVVVEFQRSTIDPVEVTAREQFYKRMVWVIDGTRSELDSSTFNISRGTLREDGLAQLKWWGRSRLFHR
ncbi:competence protein CoiA [Pseudomonas saponiphila]|uniref:competence protein CoiA n=1 Tax=Pseudomonas saponiphila TaxID=556534 RepID=UPI0022407866|nr:competence protein CoiA family protein [Pseudomonas saponiphila]